MAIDYNVPGFAFPKGSSRLADRKATVEAEKKAEQQAKAAVWKRDKHRCRACGKAVKRGSVDSLLTGHVHHVVYRGQGGTWDTKWLVLLCAVCHSDEHAGKLTVTAKTTRGADGPMQVVRRKA